MAIKLVNATELKAGNFAIIDGAPCVIKNVDKSKPGKHGASKCRIEAIGLLDSKKRITVMPGSERVSIPIIEKRKAQVLNVDKEKKEASVMDLENFETIQIPIAEEVLEEIQENSNVEYWVIENEKIVKRTI